MISPPSVSGTSMRAVSGMHCAVEFQALPSRIGQVRRIVSAQLRYWRLDPLIDPAALGLTELLANVHRHATSDKHCTIEIAFAWERLTISVRDHDPRLPSVRTGSGTSCGTATSGRGLELVAAVSDSWGMRAQDDGSGKTVWFTLPVHSAEAADPPPSPPPSPSPSPPPEPSVSPSAPAARESVTPMAVAVPGAAAAAPRERQPRTSPA